MKTVQVETPGGSYPIHIAPGQLSTIAQSVPADATAIALITNPTIATHYGSQVHDALATTGKPVLRIELPDGEAYKDWQTLNLIFDALLAYPCDRKVVLVALGGGVIGDMVGFAAACYMRGVRFIQVPTTLLAQVDSSVGGKTAINHPLGKNMVGAFYQPVAVQIDTDVLRTLPAREISAGLAEVIKYGLIIDAEFFAWCEENAAALRALEPQAISHAIQRSCELKAHVVGQDERESGLRAILNFGHTFGHAIEAGLGYGEWLHGEAVGCGMVLAAELSARIHGLPASDVARVRALVEAIGCPAVPPSMDVERWLSLMRVDKKTEGGQLRFVLVPRVGEAVCQNVPDDEVRAVLQAVAAVDVA
ncbi:3-dehydroquinate synthase [Pusillimonas sp. CC-YST705]|uniref:3-dehydroquinate synthase n=1 Tax=Mesopusillimonas faecipullorum TaxID=2755040 RepID=A0ABS8CFS6_9BURK|nr:3-dehydroquinate synthase [Mesopusillimonas faecipullorum]MCB5364682.1 3-dehydroquinate synthase [Mesopusillimonas faecipullorum]